jgi:hypothetical membrane protein
MSLRTPSPLRSARSAAIRSRTAARVAIAGYWVLSAAVIVVNPQWNPLTRQLSEYALGHLGWLQNAAFLATALAYGSLALAVRHQVRGTAGRIGLGLLFICALGSIGVGVFVTDPMTTPPDALTTHGLLHTACGASALVLLPPAALLITRSLARPYPARSRARRILQSLALLPLAGLLLIWVPEVAGLIPIGWPDRTLFLTYTAWIVTLASHPATANTAVLRTEAASAPLRTW